MAILGKGQEWQLYESPSDTPEKNPSYNLVQMLTALHITVHQPLASPCRFADGTGTGQKVCL